MVCDQSPCLHRMRDHIKSMPLYEPAEFILDFLAPHLKFNRTDTPIAVYFGWNCDLRRAFRCKFDYFACKAHAPARTGDMDRDGYSNSRTCEIGLTANSGIPYKSIAYLVNDCTEPLKE